MAAFFARRIIGGVATWFVATFLFYSLLISLGLPLQLQICEVCSAQKLAADIQRPAITYALDQPWPANYLAWLLNPEGTTVHRFSLPGEVIFGGRLPGPDFTFVRSSLLAGDFGSSWKLAPGTSALALYGLDPGLLSPVLATLFSFMLIAVLQRSHRPYAYRSSRIPANARWRPAELWAAGSASFG